MLLITSYKKNMCNEEKDSLTIKPLDNFFQAMLSISILGIILFFICGVEKDIILLFWYVLL